MTTSTTPEILGRLIRSGGGSAGLSRFEFVSAVPGRSGFKAGAGETREELAAVFARAGMVLRADDTVVRA